MADPMLDSPLLRAMAGRILAQDEIIETLLVTLFLERGQVFEDAFMAQIQNRFWAQTARLNDEAAEWWADISVQSRGSRDLLLERVKQGVQHARAAVRNASS